MTKSWTAKSFKNSAYRGGLQKRIPLLYKQEKEGSALLMYPEKMILLPMILSLLSAAESLWARV